MWSLKSYLPNWNFIGSATPNTRHLTQKAIPHIFQLERLKDLDLYEITVDQLQNLYSSSRLTSLEYVEFCLRRIHAVRYSPVHIVVLSCQ